MAASFVKAIAIVITTGTTSTNSITPTNAGDLLVVDVFDGNNTSPASNVTVADNVNAGGYTQDGTNNLTVDQDLVCVYSHANVAASATTITVTRPGSGGSLRIQTSEYTGVVTSSPRDGTAVTGYNAGSASVTSATFTPSQSGDVLHAAVGAAATQSTFTAGGSFVVETNQFTSGQAGGSLQACDQILAGSSATALAATLGTSAEWASIMVAYKASAGGAAVVHTLMSMGMGN